MVDVKVDPELEEIVPGFVERTIKMLEESSKKQLAKSDIQLIAHRLSGTAGGYGLVELGEMAMALESKCKEVQVQNTQLQDHIKKMYEYIKDVKIIYE